MAVLSYYPWLYPLFATLFGLLIGSFLNVVIYRLPIMMERQWRQECHDCFPELDDPQHEDNIASTPFNLSVPRSRCPHCNHAISALENIPLISWLVLKGKCRECKAPISKRYPAIELLTAVMSLTVALVLPPTWWAVAVVGCSFALIALTFIDIDKMLLPDQITLPLMWGGILLALIGISPISLTDSIIGAMAGYLSLWSVFWAFKLLTKKDGMGYGDFKLLAAIGAWVGWALLPFVVLLSSLVGAICGIIMLRRKHQDQQTPFSFGPYLAVAGWIAMLWGEPILHWYVTSYLGY